MDLSSIDKITDGSFEKGLSLDFGGQSKTLKDILESINKMAVFISKISGIIDGANLAGYKN